MSAKGIGFVAPDFDGRAHFNTLRVRPEYRITLKLGAVEDLFASAPDTAEGRMARLQVLGLFYLPLTHAKAKTRFKDTWDWFKTKILGGKTDAEADVSVQNGLKTRLVSGAAIPAWTDAAGAGLPPDAADPANPAATDFGKIRVPGGYSFVSFTGLKLNEDTKRPGVFTVDTLYSFEELCYTDNPAMGKLPLVMKVERRADPNSAWAPAKDVAVHVQLQTPFDLPAFAPGTACHAQFNRPPLGESDGMVGSAVTGQGPRKFVTAAEDANPTVNDPQLKNCHKNQGGKRGHGALTDGSDVVDAKLFLTASTPGFNAAHPKRKLPHKDYPVAAKAVASGDKHKHAVVAKTNEDGEAGVVFSPSRMGGDRYRLRAYVGPPSQTSDGTDPGATQSTTGTLVVWRNARLSRYVRQDVAAAPDARLVAQATAEGKDLLQDVGAHDGAAFVGLPTALFDDPHAGAGGYDPIPLQFGRAFCEIEKDQAAPEALDPDDWIEARKQALADAKKGAKKQSLPSYDLSKLFCMDLTFASPDEAVFHVPMRSWTDYNAGIGFFKGIFTDKFPLDATGAPDAQAVTDLSGVMTGYAMPGFLRYFSKDGALPGLTVVQAAFGYGWQGLIPHLGISGLATEYRGAFVWAGNAYYPPTGAGLAYSYSCNTVHELGHVVYQQHAMGLYAAGRHAPGAQQNHHDDPHTESVCVMSYLRCLGLLCGKTLLMLRGWKYDR